MITEIVERDLMPLVVAMQVRLDEVADDLEALTRLVLDDGPDSAPDSAGDLSSELSLHQRAT